MTYDGLKEDNLVTGESKKVTDSMEEVSFKSYTSSSDKVSKRRKRSRLQFTGEELSDSRLQKAIKHFIKVRYA